MKWIWLLLLSVAALGQQITITGTVKDSNGNVYANGSGRAVITPSGTQFLFGNSPIPATVPILNLTAAGTFSVQLYRTDTLSWNGFSNPPLWQFSFCNNTGSTCFTMTPIALTSPQDITSTIVAQATVLPSTGGVGNIVNRYFLNFNCSGLPNCTQIFADGQAVADATSNSTTTVTCPNNDCNFTSSDAYGRPIMKVGQKIWATTSANLAFSTYVCPVTTVASFTAQSVVLNLACTASGTANVALYWGDDDGTTLHNLALQCVNYTVPSGVYILTSRGFMNSKPTCATTGTAASLNFPFPGLSASAGNNTGFYITPDFNYADCVGSNGQVTVICIGGALGQIEKLFITGTGLTPAANANCGNGQNKVIISGGTQGMVIHNVVVAGVCPGESGMIGVEVFGADAIFDDGGAVDVGVFACQSDGVNVYFSSNDCENRDVAGAAGAGTNDGLFVHTGILNDFQSYRYVNAEVASGAQLNAHGTQFAPTATSFALLVDSGGITTHDGDTFTCTVANTGCIKLSGTARTSLRNVTFTGASTNSAINMNTGATLIDQGGNQVTGTGQVLLAQTATASSVMGDQVVTGVCQGTATAASTLGLFGAGENTTPNCTSTTVNLGVPMTRAGTLMGLGVTAGTGGVNASSGVVTVMKTTAGSTTATALTCTLGTATFCEDSTHNVAYAVGDVISIQFTTQTAETLANVKANVLAW